MPVVKSFLWDKVLIIFEVVAVKDAVESAPSDNTVIIEVTVTNLITVKKLTQNRKTDIIIPVCISLADNSLFCPIFCAERLLQYFRAAGEIAVPCTCNPL